MLEGLFRGIVFVLLNLIYYESDESVPLISRFDPWRSSLCTCPPKLTFNPYSGCDHSCVYCYASSYVRDFSCCRPKKDLLVTLRRESLKLKGEVVSMANSSDPYPRLEAEEGLTRECLKILSEAACKVQIITKSDLVLRDVDLLSKVPSTVAFTITTDDDEIGALIEPNAPSPSKRLRAVEALVERGVAVSVRLDPVIPFVNDNPSQLVSILASMGVKHITSSTFKMKRDSWKRLTLALPKVAERLTPLYFKQGERVGGNTLLPKDLRFKIMKNIRSLVLVNGLKFGVCREGLSELNTAACDGSWLLPNDLRGK
jgi:DNA repair photolyase